MYNADFVDSVARQFINDPVVAHDPGTQNGVRYAKETVRKMLGTLNLVGWGMWAATGAFAVAAVLLISTTVRLSIFARRREVEIMRLVGATNWFIRWPFVLEGFITGLVGAVLAAGAVYVGNWALSNWVESSHIDFLSIRVFPIWWQGELAARSAADPRLARRLARRCREPGGVASLPQDLIRRAAGFVPSVDELRWTS